MINEQNKFLEYAKGYNNIFSKEIMDYINALIMLETSILKSENISEEGKQILMNVELFKNLVKFNLYQGTVKLFFEEGKKLGLRCGEDSNSDMRLIAAYDDTVWTSGMSINMKVPNLECERNLGHSEYFSLLSYERRYDQSNNEQKNIILNGPNLFRDSGKYKEDMRQHFVELFEKANEISDRDYVHACTKIIDGKYRNERWDAKAYGNINVKVYKKTLY